LSNRQQDIAGDPKNVETSLAAIPNEPADSALAKVCGMSTTGFAEGVFSQALATFSRDLSDSENVDQALSAFKELAPRDGLEGMLIAQMIGSHNLTMSHLRRAAKAADAVSADRSIELATKLQRTFVAQLEALNRHRGKGQQRVTVEHVTVNAGGQAVVGSIKGILPTAQGARGYANEK